VQRLLLSVMLLCVACGPIEGDAFDAGAMDAGEVLVDGGADDGGDLIDKQNGTNAYPSEWPKPEDFQLLPYSLLMRPKYVYGFDTSLLPAIWVYNDWPGENVSWLGRDGTGSWYRARSYSTTMGYVARDILPKPYTCQTGFWGAECVRDGHERGAVPVAVALVRLAHRPHRLVLLGWLRRLRALVHDGRHGSPKVPRSDYHRHADNGTTGVLQLPDNRP
jgi:hypothetical protein